MLCYRMCKLCHAICQIANTGNTALKAHFLKRAKKHSPGNIPTRRIKDFPDLFLLVSSYIEFMHRLIFSYAIYFGLVEGRLN